MSTIVLPELILESEVKRDLMAGAFGRLREASWRVRCHAELITHDENDPFVEIATCRSVLDEAERQAKVLKSLNEIG